MAEVVWTDGALRDLERITSYIGDFSPLASQRTAVRLISAALDLETFPNRGRVIDHGRRELTVVPPYLIRYRVEESIVRVLELRHGAREPET